MNIKQYIDNPKNILIGLLNKLSVLLTDSAFIKCQFYLHMGRRLNLKAPMTYNEKLNWLKIHDHNPLYTQLVDKYAVKNYVAKAIGQQHIIKTLGVWDNFDDINFNTLPNSFVLKTTHGGGNTGVVICKDKTSFDFQKAREILNKSLRTNIYSTSREWPYKNVHRRILAEEFLDNKGEDLPDYKFFCFNGEVKALFIGTERGSGDVKFDFYDADFNHLDLVQAHPMSMRNIRKPITFEKMKEIASQLSKGFPHVRIDLYEYKGNVYFGEFTFYHHGGVVPFHPEKWDYVFGSWIELPTKKN